MSAAARANRIGQLIGGKYRIVRFLAEGGMGVVYEAQHTVVRRRFAVKFLRPDLAERRDILTRFQREAESAGALESENVTAAVDFGIVDDGTPYIVMEYLVGESLGALLERQRRLPVGRAVDLVGQACRGIQAAHASGIVHRDLKPQNLYVCRRDDGTDLVKVLDFGVAKLQAVEEKGAATRTGTVVGTPSYMSPEQARGDKVVNHRTDVYALGAILYELLSGRKPHPGDSNNAILYHISTQPAVPLGSVEPDLPPPLGEIVERALSSDPAARHASAESFGVELAPFGRREVWPEAPSNSGRARADLSSTVLAPGDPLRAGSVTPSLTGSTADELGRPAATRRRLRTRIALAVGAAALAGGVFVAVGLRGRGSGGPLPSVTTDRRAPPESSVASAPSLPSPSLSPSPSPLPAPPPSTVAPPPPVVVPEPTSAAPTASTRPIGRPTGRPTGRPAVRAPVRAPVRAGGHDRALSGERTPARGRSAASTPPASAPEDPAKARPAPVTFDQQNPYN